MPRARRSAGHHPWRSIAASPRPAAGSWTGSETGEVCDPMAARTRDRARRALDALGRNRRAAGDGNAASLGGRRRSGTRRLSRAVARRRGAPPGHSAGAARLDRSRLGGLVDHSATQPARGIAVPRDLRRGARLDRSGGRARRRGARGRSAHAALRLRAGARHISRRRAGASLVRPAAARRSPDALAPQIRGLRPRRHRSGARCLAGGPALQGRGKRLLSLLLVVVTLGVLLTLRSRSAMLAVVMAMAVWPVARLLPRAAATLIGAGLIALVAVRIHQAVPRFDNSAIHRFLIWHFAIDRIAEKPLLGWGLDASRALPGGSEPIEEPRLPELLHGGTLWMPLHPHNAALQWRVELGLPGAALATLVVLYILWCASAPETGPPALRAASLAAVAGALVVAMLSYGFWQAWWQSSLWLIGALMVALAPGLPSAPSAER